MGRRSHTRTLNLWMNGEFVGAAVARALRNTLAPGPVGGRDASDDEDFRISIAGAREKTALLWFNGQWCMPHGATPTTHIFKPPLGLVGNLKFGMSDSVENEWLCSEILYAYGLPVARTPGGVATVRAVLPAGFPMHVADAILNGLQEAADNLAG